MVWNWLAGFCVGSGSTGLLLGLSSVCVTPSTYGGGALTAIGIGMMVLSRVRTST